MNLERHGLKLEDFESATGGNLHFARCRMGACRPGGQTPPVGLHARKRSEPTSRPSPYLVEEILLKISRRVLRVRTALTQSEQPQSAPHPSLLIVGEPPGSPSPSKRIRSAKPYLSTGLLTAEEVHYPPSGM